MNHTQTQTITFALLFSVLCVFGISQYSLTAKLSLDSHPLSNFFNQQQPQSLEAAELERQSSLNCAQ
jgi:hypothetical protein